MWWNGLLSLVPAVTLCCVLTWPFIRRIRELERDAKLRQSDLDQLSMALRAHRKTLVDIADSAGFTVDECSALLDYYLKLEGRRQTLGAGTNGTAQPSSGGKK
jgi:alkylhydroperoxidase family enzyme